MYPGVPAELNTRGKPIYFFFLILKNVLKNYDGV
jgi:hypothetical protein